MLAFNQPLSIIHGSLISFSQTATDQDRLLCVRKAILEIVRSCKSEDEVVTVRREIHLFLLINTDIPWVDDLMENEAFSSLFGSVPKLSLQLYMDIVSSHNLWPYLVESVPFLPPPSLSPVVELCLAQKMFSPLTSASAAVLTGLAISCCSLARRSGGQEGREVLTKVLKKFAEETLKDEKAKQELKSIHLLNVLMVIKYLCVPLDNVNEKLVDLYAFKNISKSKEETVFCSEIESVLVIFKALVCNFSFDSWISLTEVSTASILEQRQLVPYWPGQFAPSNMQLLLAHMQAECKLLLQDGCKLQELKHVKEVLEIMSGFAQIYDRKVELNMEEMELEGIFQQLEISEGWKKQAFVDHLLEQDLKHVLWDETQLDKLNANHESLGRHVGKLINHLIQNDQTLSVKQTELVGKILDNLNTTEVEETFASFHSQFGLTQRLRREDFSQRFVSILNRTSVNTTKELFTKKEFLILAMEDGESVIRDLFEEGSNNKGKVDTCSMLMILLVNVCKAHSDGFPLFSKLVRESIVGYENSGRNRENVFTMTSAVLESEPCFSQDILELATEEVWAQFVESQLERAACLADMVLGMLRQKSVMGFIGHALKQKVGVLFITLLNNLSVLQMGREKTFKMKEVSLQIVGLLFKTPLLKKNLVTLLKKEFLSYFVPVDCPTLLDHIHHTYWQGDDKLCGDKLSPAQLSSQLLSCLPQLLQSEWKCLPALLESLCPTAPVLGTIIDCLVLALEKTGPGLAYHMVLALCSLITSMVTTTTCQETVGAVLRELFMLLEVVPVDLRDVIWPCLHNTLGKYLTLPNEERDMMMREVLAMMGMRVKCGDRDILVRMLQQSII